MCNRRLSWIETQVVLVTGLLLAGCSTEHRLKPATSKPVIPAHELGQNPVAVNSVMDSSEQRRIPPNETPVGANPAPIDKLSHMKFVDVTAQSRITFRHTTGGSGRTYIVETVTAGLALFDYDGDGFVDIYFLTGKPLPGTEVKDTPTSALYRNNGDWTFTDVTRAAGVADSGYGLGVTAGDYDNDGDTDLYVNNFGPTC